MEVIKTAIPEVKIFEPQVFSDERGFVMETFRQDFFDQQCGETHFLQENHSKSEQGILRGLHYQTQSTQGKLVRVTAGEVFDVAVDLRRYSPTFGHVVSVVLSVDNKRQFWVPEGFAHGFYVTSEYAEFSYKCTDYYAPAYERSLRWDDPELAIDWPLINSQLPQLSDKDQQGDFLCDAAVFDLP